MSEYSYLHIALRGDVQGATHTIYSYPSAGDDIDPRWGAAMVEPGAAIKRFLNASECYILQSSPRGHYFSFITRNTINPERGHMMISILVNDGCSLTGRQIMGAFNNLKKVLVEDEALNDSAVEEALAMAGVPEEALRLEAWRYHASVDGEKPAEAAYRTYISQQELESIFSFPCQPDYGGYRCIIVVSATCSLRPGVKMPRLTLPVRKLYSVVCPEGVSASSMQVYDGDRLELSFSKDGFDTHKESVITGTPSAYTKYEGPTIMIRSASQTGVRFVRRIDVKVVSANGKQLNGYTIAINDRSVNTMEPYIEFLEKDLIPGKYVDIEVQSNNYRPLKLKKSSEEMLHTDELEFVMQPVEQGITLKLDFGDGRVLEHEISIEKNTPEYNRLHSGNFHGFRANRLVTGDDREIYNVDLRSKGLNESSDNESSDNGIQSEPCRAPKFENISDEVRHDAPKINNTLPVSEDRTSVIQDEKQSRNIPDYELEYDDVDEVSGSKPWYKKASFLWSGLTVVVAVVVLCLLIPQYIGSPDDSVPAEESTDGDLTDVPVRTPDMSAEERADVEYLNTYPVWEVSKMQSQMGKSLMEAIARGDIDAVIANDYFSVRGRATNDKAILFADLIWRAKGSPSENGNRKTMRSAAKNGSIDLKSLSDNLARRRPAERANESVRPVK